MLNFKLLLCRSRVPLLATCVLLAACDLLVSPQQRIERAEQAMNAGDDRAAEIELRNALQKAPDDARGRLLLARISYRLGDAAGAERELARALAAGADPADLARLQADVLRTLGRHEKLAAFVKAPQPGLPDYARSMFLGYAQLGQQQTEAALASFAAAVAQATEPAARAEALTAQAIGLATADDTTAAMAALDAALAVAPGNLPALTTRAKLAMRVGDFGAAESALAPAVSDDATRNVGVAERVAALETLCEARLGMGKFREARASLDQLTRLVGGSPLVAYLGGRIALADGQSAEAVAQLQRAVQAAPDFLPARMALGIANVERGNFAQAEAELQRVVEAAPDNVEARRLLAQVQLRQGRADAAAAVLEPALAIAVREGLPSLLSLGRLEIAAGREDVARRAYESAVAANPTNGAAYLSLAALADSKGDPVGAKQWLERWRTADKDASQPRLLLARDAFASRDPAAGHALVEEAIQCAPRSAPVADAAGIIFMEAGLYEEALGQLHRASTLDDRNPVYLLHAARAQLAIGHGAAARLSLRRALNLKPNWVPATALLVQIELRERRVDQALALATALQKDPNAAAIGHLMEGDILFASGQASRAETAFAESARQRPSREAATGQTRSRVQAGRPGPADPLAAWVKDHPTDLVARLELAQAYQVTGQVDAAVAEYEAVLQERPDALLALNNLAVLYGDRGDPRAIEVARRAVASAPRVGSVVDTLGWNLVRAGQLEEGLRHIQQAHDFDKENPEITYHLGAALVKAGRKVEARALLDRAVAAGGSAPWVAEARKARAEAG